MVVLSWMQRRREKYEGREVGKLGTEGVSRMTRSLNTIEALLNQARGE